MTREEFDQAEVLRVAIRGFADGVLKFEDRIDIPKDGLDALLPELAEKHGAAMEEHGLQMIEIEFLDEPDREQALFRIGTDTRGMVLPIAFDLTRLKRND